MTHPTLGYTNFRFDGDDAVHMAAFNGAGHIIACDAEGPTEHDLWPHGVDAPVDCENCVRARLADWWMARAEQQRREGAEAVWPEPTLNEVYEVAELLASEVDTKMEATILWGDGDMPEQPIVLSTSNDYHFAQDMLEIKARQGKDKAYRTVNHLSQRSQEELDEALASMRHQLDRERVPIEDAVKVAPLRIPDEFLGDVIDRHDNDAKLARYLARSPLSYLASDAGKNAPEEILFGSTSMLPSAGGFTGRRLGLSPEEEAEGPDFGDEAPEPSNWCHVHNRTTEAGREECPKCNGERGGDRKAGES